MVLCAVIVRVCYMLIRSNMCIRVVHSLFLCVGFFSALALQEKKPYEEAAQADRERYNKQLAGLPLFPSFLFALIRE